MSKNVNKSVCNCETTSRLLRDLVNGTNLLYSASLEVGAPPAFLRHLSVAAYHLQCAYDVFTSCRPSSQVSYSEFLRRCFSGIESK